MFLWTQRMLTKAFHIFPGSHLITVVLRRPIELRVSPDELQALEVQHTHMPKVLHARRSLLNDNLMSLKQECFLLVFLMAVRVARRLERAHKGEVAGLIYAAANGSISELSPAAACTLIRMRPTAKSLKWKCLAGSINDYVNFQLVHENETNKITISKFYICILAAFMFSCHLILSFV